MASPKDRFHQHPDSIKAWNLIAEGGLFQAALDVAMLEMAAGVARAAGAVYDAQAAAHRLQGAVMFAEILAKLGIKDVPRGTSKAPDLEYESFGVALGMVPGTKKQTSGL